jgi:hypothetical protein
VAHFVPSRGTSRLKVFLCHAVAHFVPSCGTWYYVPSCKELQVKNCKSRIASQELQVKNCKKSLLDSLDIFSRGLMNERIFSLVFIRNCWTEMLARLLGHIIILVHFRSKR